MTLRISPAVETVRDVVDLKDLRNINKKWLKNELEKETEKAVREEDIRQRRIGNLPSRAVTDRKASKDLTDTDVRLIAGTSPNVRIFPQMERRLTFYYTETLVLAEAVAYAWRALTGLMRRVTGTAWRSINFYVRDFENLGNSREYNAIGGVINHLEKSTSSDLVAYILGPTIEYRRTAIYYHSGSGGKTRQSTFFTKLSAGYKRDPNRKGLNRLEFTKPKETNLSKYDKSRGRGIVLKGSRRGRKVSYQMLLAKAVHQLVRDRVRRQFRDISVRYKFHPGRGRNDPLPISDHSPTWRPTGKNEFIPVLILGSKAKGKTRIF